jgi:hypothetical protein
MSVTVEQLKRDMQKAKEANQAVETALKEQDRINKEIAEAESLENLETELKKIAERKTLSDKLRQEQDRINNQTPEEKLKIVKRIELLQQLQLTNELVRIAEKDLKGLEQESVNITDKILIADQHLKELKTEQLNLNNDIKINS